MFTELERKVLNADALSLNPCGAAPTEGIGESEIQVSKVECDVDEVPVLLELEPYSSTSDTNRETLATEQQKDHQVAEILTYLRTGALPKEEQRARKIAAQANLFGMDDNVLYYIDPKHKSRKRAVVPHHLKERLIKSVHGESKDHHDDQPDEDHDDDQPGEDHDDDQPDEDHDDDQLDEDQDDQTNEDCNDQPDMDRQDKPSDGNQSDGTGQTSPELKGSKMKQMVPNRTRTRNVRPPTRYRS